MSDIDSNGSASKKRSANPTSSINHSNRKSLNVDSFDAKVFHANSVDHETDQHASLAGALPSSVSQKNFHSKDNSDNTIRDQIRSNLDQEPPAASASRPKKPLRDGPVVIEMFAGSGRLTAALKACGVHSAFGVDHKKLSSIAPIMIADLTTRAGQSFFMTWMEAPNLAGIFAAPPCGTCSLARNIKVRGPKGNIISGPVPLRSQVFPEGFPNLTKTNLKRVLAANKLYDFLATVVEKANQRNLIVVIENPRSSLFWLTTYFQKIKHLFTFVAHQACAYGSERPKWTALAVNRPEFQSINMTCPGLSKDHRHKPWGLVAPDKFATAEETAYPPQLAHSIAKAFTLALASDGWKPPTATWEELKDNPSFAAMRAVAGRQPKASKTPPLVSEHRQVVSVLSHVELVQNPPCPIMGRIKTPWVVPQGFNNTIEVVPADAQLLRVCQTRTMGGKQNELKQIEKPLAKLVWGIPWKPDEFVKQAVSKGHPRSFGSLLPEVLQDAVNTNLSLSSAEVAQMRSQWFKKWVHRAQSLSSQEAEFKKSLAPHLQHILQPKRLILLKEIIETEGHPDKGVFEELAFGTELTGCVPSTGVFDPVFKPALITSEELAERAESSNKAIFRSVRSSGDAEVDTVVFQKTLEERDAGWLRGPVPFHELGKGCVLSRRFGLKQPNKVRLIDDLSKSNINSTVQTPESPRPHSTDVVASMALAVLLGASNRNVVGKTFDLKSAYRQLGIHPNSLSCSYIACFDPVNRQPAVFQMLAVPFGGSRSVYSFLRIVRLIWWIACKCLAVMWSNFYDDFVTLSFEEDAERTSTTVELLFNLLGWQFAQDGDKALPFGSSFGALGIHIDLLGFQRGFVEFSNTDRRKADLKELILSIVEAGLLSHADALKLRGRLQFADGQLFGRLGKLCLKEITDHAFSASGSKISSRLRQLLTLFQSQLLEGPPRKICGVTASCFYIFTDACFEPGRSDWSCGLGGIIYDSRGLAVQAFSFCLTPSQLDLLGAAVKKTVIFEAELLALIVAFVLWKNIIHSAPVVFYIDNNSARDVAISACSRSKLIAGLVEQLLRVENLSACFCWFARVPSPSNPADDPSRGELSELLSAGVPLVDVSDIIAECLAALATFLIG